MNTADWKETYSRWENEGTGSDWLSFFEETLGEYRLLLEKGTYEAFMTFLEHTEMVYYQEPDSWLKHLHWLAEQLQRKRKQNREEVLNLSSLENRTMLLEKMVTVLEPLRNAVPPGLKPGMMHGIKKAVLLKRFNQYQRIVNLAIPLYIADPQAPMIVQEMISPLQAALRYVELAETARSEGILALEDIFPDLPPAISRYMTLVVDGTDPDLIEKTLEFHYDSWSRKIQSLQEVFALGIKGIIHGHNPFFIKEMLLVPGDIYTSAMEKGNNRDNNEELVKENYDHGKYLEIITGMADQARRMGLLSLGNFDVEDPAFPAFMLKELVLAILDLGEEKIDIDELVAISFDRIREELALARKIISKGTLMIQVGENPVLIKKELNHLIPENIPLSAELSEYIENLANPESQNALIHFSGLYDQYAMWNNAAPDPGKINAEELEELKKSCQEAQKSILKFLGEESAAAALLEKNIHSQMEDLKTLYRQRFPDFKNINTFIPEGKRDAIAGKMALLLENIRVMEREALNKIARAGEEQLSAVFNELDWPDGSESWTDVNRGKQELLDKPVMDHILGLYKAGSDEIDSFIEKLEQSAPETAEELKKEIFSFEDILLLDDRAVQKVLRETDTAVLAMSLKGSDNEVREKIFRNMSQFAAASLKEEMEYMGPIRKKDGEESRITIVELIRKLEEAGEIVIPRGGEDDFLIL